MNILIREFRPEEISKIIDLREELAYSLAEINPQRLPKYGPELRKWYEEMVLQKIGDEQGRVYVAEVDGQIVGYAFGYVKRQSDEEQLEFLHTREGEIVDLYVLESFRNQTVGAKLIETMEGHFKDVGCEYVLLEVLSENKGIELYKRLGYKLREVIVLKSLKEE